jgi:hypothetical protein
MTTRPPAFLTTTLLLGATALAGPPEKPTFDGPHETGTRPPRPVAPERIEHSVPAIDLMAGPAGFVSVQVNVADGGLNIVGDAANEPSIAVDPTDPSRIVIGWRQFDTIASDFREAGYAYSHDGGACWTFPGVHEDGVFRSDPVLAADRFGNIYYNSLHTDLGADWRCDLFISGDGGVTWSGPHFAYGGDKQWMVIDNTGGIGDGNIYQAWNTAGNPWFPATYNRSVDSGFSFQPPLEIPQQPKFGSVDVGPDGEMYVVGRNGSGQFFLLRSDNARDSGQMPAFDTVTPVFLGGTQTLGDGPNPIGLLGQVWVAVDRSEGPSRGYVYVLCSINRPGLDPLDIMFTRSVDGGASFSSPMRINDDVIDNEAWQWFGTMSVAPNGRIDAIWNDTRNSPTHAESELHYAFSVDAGLTWSENVAVSPPFDHSLGYPQNNKLGDYYDMVSFDDGAHVAYAATFNGEQDVYYVKITPTLPPLAFAYPDGRPDLVDPFGETVRVVVSGQHGGTPQPGTGRLHYDAGAGFVVLDMTEVAPNEYDAIFPSLPCGDEVAWYVSAETTDARTQTDPAAAPATTFVATVAEGIAIAFDDDFETDQGWTVSGDAADGPWERGTPITTCERGNPLVDGDGSGQCYLTDNDPSDCNSDVDGGTTTLTSPVMDASADGATLGYWRWYSNTFGGDPMNDVLEVEVSDDGGASWEPLETVGPAGDEVDGGWFRRELLVADIPNIEPTAGLRVRFHASDLAAGSVIEAGVDGVSVTALVCRRPGDVDGDGDVDFQDLLQTLAAWGDCPDPPAECPADFDGDGAVTFADLLIVLSSWDL